MSDRARKKKRRAIYNNVLILVRREQLIAHMSGDMTKLAYLGGMDRTDARIREFNIQLRMLTDAKRMELVERVWGTGKISTEKKSYYCADNFREAVFGGDVSAYIFLFYFDADNRSLRVFAVENPEKSPNRNGNKKGVGS